MTLYDIKVADTVYIGDRENDGISAKETGVEFILASWGYGANSDTNYRTAKMPSDLISMVKNMI